MRQHALCCEARLEAQLTGCYTVEARPPAAISRPIIRLPYLAHCNGRMRYDS